MTATKTETTPAAAVETLADKAIAAEIRKIDRIILTQQKHIKEAEIVIAGYRAQRATLVQAQIDRLRSQLPQEPKDEA